MLLWANNRGFLLRGKMRFKGVVGLLFVTLTFQTTQMPSAQATQLQPELEATSLKSGYAIRLLKPLPRRNSGCKSLFRNGEVLETCDSNYGLDPKIDGVFRTYCEWNLNSHKQKDNSAEWLESYFNPNPIEITNAKVGYNVTGNFGTIWDKFKGAEEITLRWIEVDFNDQISGSKLGSLKCYPSQLRAYSPTKKKLLGETYYQHDLSKEENDQKIKSGLSIDDILEQLEGYVSIIQTN
jgi:hypothetical protein